MKNLVLLGSTGSIGQQTLDIVRAFPARFRVLCLAAGYNLDLLAQQVREFKPQYVCCLGKMDGLLINGTSYIQMEEMACLAEADLVMVATTGNAGLLPTLKAMKQGKAVALANKEVMVMAGHLVRQAANHHGGRLLPVDSEHNAIWQCLQGEKEVQRVIITASGGPFRKMPLEELSRVTPQQALKHPTWKMGKKVTIDSATLMNKAFEVMETRWLFDLSWEKIEVVVHPQSIVHSMVEFVDGSVKAQMAPPDMHLPIQYALFYPERVSNPNIPRLDTSVPLDMTFEPLDTARYPCFSLALEAARKGGTYPAVLCGADEVAVESFIKGRIRLTDVYRVVHHTIEAHTSGRGETVEEVVAAERWARQHATEYAQTLS